MAADQLIVDGAAEHAARQRARDGDPPPMIPGAEDLAAPTGREGEEPRAQVAGRVDGIAGVEAERHPDQHHHRGQLALHAHRRDTAYFFILRG